MYDSILPFRQRRTRRTHPDAAFGRRSWAVLQLDNEYDKARSSRVNDRDRRQKIFLCGHKLLPFSTPSGHVLSRRALKAR